MKKILSSVLVVGILSISLSANEFEDSMKYVDKALTKLITENKNMKSELELVKNKNIELETKLTDLTTSLKAGFVQKETNQDIQEFIQE
jgi:predicted RNase H-like nuclease (RuvC/YqgF family)